MNFKLVDLELQTLKEPAYRLNQLQASILQGAKSWVDVRGWPKSLQQHFEETYRFSQFTSAKVLTSVDGTKKAVLTLTDGLVIETVLMSPKPNLTSVCVSCEVGCPMNCAFCATGKMGFKRFLTFEEITDQWLFWLGQASTKPSHLVFMGMGEPFHNQTNVFSALNDLHQWYDLGWRKISVSTSGIIPGITLFQKDFPQVNLAISLHSALAEVRSELMPINKAYSLSQLQDACLAYLKATNRQLMFEYLLLHEINDTKESLKALLTWLKPLPKNLIHLNLIRYNPTGSFTAPPKETVITWKKRLDQYGISVSIRKNLGVDIFGACGQLAAKDL